MNKRIDVTYVRKLQEGDLTALEEIYRFYQGPIYYYALSILKNKHDAEEVMQEVVYKVQTRIHQLKNPESFHFWMFSIASNECTSRLRVRKRFIQTDEENTLEEVIKAKNNQINDFNNSTLMGAILNSFQKLSENNRRTAELRYLSGLTLEEIAKATHVETKTVKSRLYEVRKMVSSDLKEQGYHPRKYFTFLGIPLFYKEMQLTFLKERNKVLLKDYSSMQTLMQIITNAEKISLFLSCAIASVVITPVIPAIVNVPTNDLIVLPATASNIQYKKSDRIGVIDTISYIQNPIAGPLEVRVYVYDMSKIENISITYEGIECNYQKYETYVGINVVKNGRYHVRINNDEKFFDVTNIDYDIPIVERLDFYDDSFEIVVKVTVNQVDVEKSYLLIDQQRVSFPKDFIVSVKDAENVDVILVDDKGNENCFNFKK
ncbi:RNA polymerase sigma factor (sigma-70 family) [Breznakia blatticola]|uniref:RNA polymerase sigma factor (Sigma-70 family) n=1 Tax=Breznakia blatticola TaxID=1754012 RepID=A0A4R7ZVY9_9FIRM|nr:RNA polymerase sigma factor [Breznakia blatticola]TDW19800.1 RNA polymerase sigma factor (sigma-70 family) [Breznakia blatticola]